MMIEPLFYRKEVLSLYRRIFRIARHWHELTTGDADTESQYIRNEARRLFRRYKNVSALGLGEVNTDITAHNVLTSIVI